VKYPKMEPGNLLTYLCLAYYKRGNNLESISILEQLKRMPEDKKSNTYFGLARIYSEYKKKDSCFIYLEKSFNNREPLFKTLKIDPLLDFVRSDPRYGQLYHRYGFDRYQ